MKLLLRFTRRPVRTFKVVKRKQTLSLRKSMLKLKQALAQEKAETKDMLRTYQQYLRGQADKNEMKMANRQFLDLLKGLGIGVVAILPFAPITIPVIVKLGRAVGVDILPSAFSEQDQDKSSQALIDVPPAANDKLIDR